VFTSIAAEDGYVGQYVVDGFSATTCKAGDKGMYNLDTYRTILSFDTSSIPRSATVSNAVLTITRVSLTGTLSPLIVDIKAGTFGPTATLVQQAYNGIPSAAAIGNIAVPASDSATSSFQIPASALQYVSGSNVRTQIRIREDVSNTTPGFNPRTLFIADGAATLSVNYS